MCWFAGVLAGGEACSIYARRNGNVQMCRCTNRQAPGEHGGKQLYIHIRAHTHARTSCILRRNCVHSALTMRFYLIINAFRCVDR